MKKVPMRTCVVSKEKCEKRDLLRIVRTPEKNVVIDDTGKLNGRGAYLKLEESVIDKAKTSKALNRVLEIEVPDSIYEELKSLIK